MFGDEVQELDLLNKNHRIICNGYHSKNYLGNCPFMNNLFPLSGSLETLSPAPSRNTLPFLIKIATGVYYNKQKPLKYMHNYLICCSYDELLLFKQSSAVATTMTNDNPSLVPVIVNHFDTELSSPNGLVFTPKHDTPYQYG